MSANKAEPDYGARAGRIVAIDKQIAKQREKPIAFVDDLEDNELGSASRKTIGGRLKER